MNYIEDINRILFFLASRDVMCLDVDTLKKNYQIKCAGAIMLFGNGFFRKKDINSTYD